jgi:hypothetical protein
VVGCTIVSRQGEETCNKNDDDDDDDDDDDNNNNNNMRLCLISRMKIYSCARSYAPF